MSDAIEKRAIGIENLSKKEKSIEKESTFPIPDLDIGADGLPGDGGAGGGRPGS